MISAPTCLSDWNRDPNKDEPLFSNDYHGDVYFQAWSEWNAQRAVLFTPGNGFLAGMMAVHREFPLLLLALNNEHVQLMEYFIDCAIATAMQVDGPGNRLHDKEIMNKIGAVLEGKEDSDNEVVMPKSKKMKKDDKKPKKKEASSSGSNSAESEDGTDEEESDSDDE